MTQADAAQVLTNLFASYVTSVDRAVDITELYKDFAASGGDSTLSFADKVRNLSEAHLTQMSILGNNSGLQENWNQIIKIGERITGMKYDAVSKLNQEEIKYAGLLAVHARAQGAAARFGETHLGVIMRTRTNINNLSIELGNRLLLII